MAVAFAYMEDSDDGEAGTVVVVLFPQRTRIRTQELDRFPQFDGCVGVVTGERPDENGE